MDAINEQVIADYVSNIVLSIDGVSRLYVGLTDNISNILGKDTGISGIKVTKDNDILTINIHLVVKYGINIPQLSYDIQTGVKNKLEEYTGMEVDAVNITVQGIDRSI